MKKSTSVRLLFFCGITALVVASFVVQKYWLGMTKKTTTVNEVKTEEQVVKSELPNLMPIPPDKVYPEKMVRPKTQAEVEEIYHGINMVQIPRVFIEELPPDWQIRNNEDKTLFMKIITALILRTNEKIKAEKKRLIRLQEKFLWQMAWTPEEEAFFNMLVQKYDVFTKKKREGQLQELIEKVDIIPPSIAVVQAIWYTDWGRKNQKSIYGEYGWIKEEAYQPLEFESLADATDSFALQINSRSQLHQFHQIRRQYMFFAHRKSIGLDIIDMMAQFMDWDKQYVEKVGRTYGKGFILELDLAKFKNEDE